MFLRILGRGSGFIGCGSSSCTISTRNCFQNFYMSPNLKNNCALSVYFWYFVMCGGASPTKPCLEARVAFAALPPAGRHFWKSHCFFCDFSFPNIFDSLLYHLMWICWIIYKIYILYIRCNFSSTPWTNISYENFAPLPFAVKTLALLRLWFPQTPEKQSNNQKTVSQTVSK